MIAIVLALPFGGFVLFDNLSAVSNKLAVEPELSIYLSPSASRDKANALVGPLKQALEDAQRPADRAGQGGDRRLCRILPLSPAPQRAAVSRRARRAAQCRCRPPGTSM